MRHRHIPIILLTAAVAGSCGDGPAGPGQPGEPGENVVSKEIGPDGGSITSRDGQLTIHIPEDALSAAETITITPVAEEELGDEFESIADSMGIESAYELRPDGLEFDRPVTATLPSDQAAVLDASTLRLRIKRLPIISSNGELAGLDSLRVEPADDGTEAVQLGGELSHFSTLTVTDSDPSGLLTATVTGIPAQLEVNEEVELEVRAAVKTLTVDRATFRPFFFDDAVFVPMDLEKEPVAMTEVDSGTEDEAFALSPSYTCTEVGSNAFEGQVTVDLSEEQPGTLSDILDKRELHAFFRIGDAPDVQCVQAKTTADLSVQISGTGESIEEGETAEPTVTVENEGPDEASGTKIMLDASGGTIIGIPDNEDVECEEPPAELITCNLLRPLNLEIMELLFLLEAANPGTLRLIATVDADTDDPDEANNTDEQDIPVEESSAPEIKSFGGTQTSRTAVEFTAVVDFVGSVGNLEVEFDYGDGESDVVETPEETGEDEFTAIMTHDYGSTGERTPEVTARNTETGKSATESFGIGEATITIQKDGSGTGGVNADGLLFSTIDCPPDCESVTGFFHVGNVPGFNLSVALTATASDGSVFTGWSGDLSQGEGCDGTGDCTIPINGDRTITATFETETGDGDELSEGSFEFPLRFDELRGPEAVYRLYRRSSSSAGGSSGLRASRLQVDEKQFGTLSGKLPVGFSGENGFILVDLLTDELLLSGITTLGPIGSPAFGVFGLTETPPGPDSPATVVLYGETGFGFYDTQLGGTQLGNQPTALDAFPAGGDPESGYAVGIQEGVVFIGFDEANGDHDIREVGSPASDFDGEPISAWMPDGFDPTVIPALVLARDSDPDNSLESGVYVESRNDDPPVRAADVGLDARRIRCAPNGLGTYVCAVSVFGDDEMALLTWDGTSSLPALVGTAPVGDGPVDLDMRLLESGDIAVVATGFNDNTLTVLELDTGGNVVSSTTRAVPSGCESPAHAIFVRDAVSLKVVGTCTGSDNYFVLESGF